MCIQMVSNDGSIVIRKQTRFGRKLSVQRQTKAISFDIWQSLHYELLFYLSSVFPYSGWTGPGGLTSLVNLKWPTRFRPERCNVVLLSWTDTWTPCVKIMTTYTGGAWWVNKGKELKKVKSIFNHFYWFHSFPRPGKL